MSLEHAREIMRRTANESTSRRYVQTVHQIQGGIEESINAQFMHDFSWPLNYQNDTKEISLSVDKDDPAVQAAMLDGAISLRGYRYRDCLSDDPPESYQAIWKGTSLESLAAKSEEIVDGIKPKLDGKFTHINLGEMKSGFQKNIEALGQEDLVVTGLNGVGKSTILEAFRKFVWMLGIKNKLVKLPNSNNLLGKLLEAVLSGKVKLDPRARQYVFLAELLNLKPHPDTFVIYDRNPLRDAIVYGPRGGLETAILATGEVFEGSIWTVILDRHFMRTRDVVKERRRQPRIFESESESMIEQYLRFAALTVLPGVIWINNDIPVTGKDINWPVESSVRRFFGSVLATGVIQRHMLKQKLVSTTESADWYLSHALMEFMRRWKETPDWIKKLG